MTNWIEKAEWKRAYPANRDNTTSIKLEADFGIKDLKGRAVGGQAIIDIEVHFRDGDYSILRPTGNFNLRVRSTRNGEDFGTSNGTHTYPSLEEAKVRAMIALDKKFQTYSKLYSAK